MTIEVKCIRRKMISKEVLLSYSILKALIRQLKSFTNPLNSRFKNRGYYHLTTIMLVTWTKTKMSLTLGNGTNYTKPNHTCQG